MAICSIACNDYLSPSWSREGPRALVILLVSGGSAKEGRSPPDARLLASRVVGH